MIPQLIDGLISGDTPERISERTGLSVSDIEAVRNSPLIRLKLRVAELDTGEDD